MVIWMWRLFARYVIGVKPGTKCRLASYACESGRCAPSPICLRGFCRACCIRRCSSPDCEKQLTREEVELLADFRKPPQLRGVA